MTSCALFRRFCLVVLLSSVSAIQTSAAILIYETFDNGFVNDGTLTGGSPASGVSAGNYVAAAATQVAADGGQGSAYSTTNSMFRSGVAGVDARSRNADSVAGFPVGVTSFPLFTGLTRTDSAGNSGTNYYMVSNDTNSSPIVQAPVVINNNSVFMISFDFYEPTLTSSTVATTANFAVTLTNGAPLNGSGTGNNGNRLVQYTFRDGFLANSDGTTVSYTVDATHHVDFVGNVSDSAINYGPGNMFSLAANSTDIYIDGVLVIPSAPFFRPPGTESVPPSGTVATRFGFFTGNATASAYQSMYIDNLIVRDDIPSNFLVPEPSVWAILLGGVLSAAGMMRRKR